MPQTLISFAQIQKYWKIATGGALVLIAGAGVVLTLQTRNSSGVPTRQEYSDGASTQSGDLLVGSGSQKNILRANGLVVLNSVQYRFPYTQASASGKVLKNDGNGNLSWSTDLNTGGGGSATVNTGAILAAGDSRFVNVSGDTMTGTLVLNPAAGLALNARGTMSGRALTVSGLNAAACDVKSTNGVFSCGTDSTGTDSADDLSDNNTSQLAESGNLYFTDERAQDAVGATLTDTASLDFTYNDGAATISAVVLPAGVDHGGLGGLSDDDHTIYVLASGTRPITGDIEILATASGRVLHAQDQLRSSGSLAVEGGFWQDGFGTCNSATQKPVYSAATGKFTCGTDTDTDTNTPAWSGTGALRTAFDRAYVNTAGDTMTGKLLINLSSGTDALEIIGVGSGRQLHAQDKLTTSGSLAVQTTGRFKGNLTTLGTMSGAAAPYFAGLNAANCDVKSTNGQLSCGTDATGGAGSFDQAETDKRYVQKQGDTMTGALTIIQSGVGLNVTGTMSGKLIRIAGTGATAFMEMDTSKGLLSMNANNAQGLRLYTTTPTGAGGGVDAGYLFAQTLPLGLVSEEDGTILSYAINVSQVGAADNSVPGGIFRLDTRNSGAESNGNRGFVILGRRGGDSSQLSRLAVSLETGNTYLVPRAGNVGIGIKDVIPDTKLSVSGAVVINGAKTGQTKADSGITLEVIGTSSGRILHAQDQLRSSGSLVIEGNAAIQGVLTLSSALSIANGGTALTAAPTKSLSIVGLRGASVAGAMVKQINYGSNAVDLVAAEFGENGTPQYAFAEGILPDSYNGGTFTVRVHWTTTATSGDVEWNIQCAIRGDNEALDAAWGSAVQVTDTAATTNTVRITSASAAMTCAGTPAANKTILFRFWRDSADAQDTMAGSGRLIGGLAEYATTGYTD